MQLTFKSLSEPSPDFPGGSKSRVNKAGDAVREERATEEDFRVIERWREAHRHVLNTFQAILRQRTKGERITVAQRHKRLRTILNKLHREKGMHLVRMDDIAGCRLIFGAVPELYDFRREFFLSRFEHERRNESDRYDYIKHPKETGYRGIHDVYEYNVNSTAGRRLKGLYVELQYRTLVQHSWATAVELIGHLTESQPKFRQGDKRYEVAMALASEILARAFESEKGPFPDSSNTEVIQQFASLDEELGLMTKFRALNAIEVQKTKHPNLILILRGGGVFDSRSYRYTPQAMQALFELERQMPDADIVLVRADTSQSVRVAYRNYYADAKDFVDLVERGIAVLSK